jgi:hypothetical protein
MEQDHPGGVVQEQAEMPERVGQDRGKWVVPKRVQDLEENVSAPSTERKSPMRPEFLVFIKNALSVG